MKPSRLFCCLPLWESPRPLCILSRPTDAVLCVPACAPYLASPRRLTLQGEVASNWTGFDADRRRDSACEELGWAGVLPREDGCLNPKPCARLGVRGYGKHHGGVQISSQSRLTETQGGKNKSFCFTFHTDSETFNQLGSSFMALQAKYSDVFLYIYLSSCLFDQNRAHKWTSV